MRAAHSLKGAARIVNLRAAVGVAHALEDCFVAAQHGRLRLRQPQVDVLFQGVDLLGQLAKGTEASIARWETDRALEIEAFLQSLAEVITPEASANVPVAPLPTAHEKTSAASADSVSMW